MGLAVRESSRISTPAELDDVLHTCIEHYVESHSWRKLAAEIKVFVERQFASSKLRDNIIQTDYDQLVKLHTPSRVYMQDYVNGRPICLRYTNTLACFFRINYCVTPYNPADDALLRQELQKQ